MLMKRRLQCLIGGYIVIIQSLRLPIADVAVDFDVEEERV